MARDHSYCLGFGICIYMRTWCLDFDVCDHLRLLTDLLSGAWLRTTGTHPLFCLVECLCMLDIEQVGVIRVICLALVID